jgi:hypothetical protein
MILVGSVQPEIYECCYGDNLEECYESDHCMR